MICRLGVSTTSACTLIFSRPRSSAKSGRSQSIGNISSYVAWGSRKRLPPVTSSSTILVTVTAPIRHLMTALRSRPTVRERLSVRRPAANNHFRRNLVLFELPRKAKKRPPKITGDLGRDLLEAGVGSAAGSGWPRRLVVRSDHRRMMAP